MKEDWLLVSSTFHELPVFDQSVTATGPTGLRSNTTQMAKTQVAVPHVAVCSACKKKHFSWEDVLVDTESHLWVCGEGGCVVLEGTRKRVRRAPHDA